ncbi:MAG: cereulide biosynthesis operon crsT, crsX, grsA and grsB s [Crocinitomicaceae bacterium]|jgi:4'-phosphopantetheinyl transferase|nr:cereulide biosynthesis operon crsT, crsX, grsA and grsB s [Crocinitomicaceae bacterium]
MSTADLHIVYASIREISGDKLQAVFEKLTEEEQRKCSAYHRESDRQAFLIGRLLIERFVYSDLQAISYSVYGKPFIPGAPFFNLSHSGDYVVLAISENEVGVDIEFMGEVAYDELSKFFTPAEQELIRSSVHPRYEFYRIWTAKEALLKCTGKGLGLPLDSFCVAANTELRVENQNYCVQQLEILLPENYQMAVCSSENATLRIERYNGF